jgi:hypothetical protein
VRVTGIPVTGLMGALRQKTPMTMLGRIVICQPVDINSKNNRMNPKTRLSLSHLDIIAIGFFFKWKRIVSFW